MPLGYDPFDFRRYLPPEASLYTMAASADGPGSFTRPVTTRRFGPDGQPLPPDAPPATPGPTVAEGATPFPPSPMSPRVPEAATSEALDYRRDPAPVRKVAEIARPMLGATDERRVPTLASTAPPPDTFNQQLAKLVENKDFSGAAKLFAGAFPKAPKAPPVFHVSGSSGGGGGVKDMSGSGQALLATVMKGRKAEGGDLAEQKKRRRAQDRYARMPGER